MNAFAKIRFFFIIPLICAGLFSCNPDVNLPPELILEYVGYQNFNDTALDLQVRFQKGDGNLGLRDNEPGYNLHVYAMDKQLDGTYIIMRERNSQNLNIWDTVQSFHRFPVFKDANPKAPIKGKLYIPITGGVLNQIRGISQQNIIRFEIYMYDRVPVQSNIVVTPDISIR